MTHYFLLTRYADHIVKSIWHIAVCRGGCGCIGTIEVKDLWAREEGRNHPTDDVRFELDSSCPTSPTTELFSTYLVALEARTLR